jgi:hypothetical protein
MQSRISYNLNIQNLKLVYSIKVDDADYFYKNSAKALQKPKIHFGCDSMKGIQLKN